MDRLLTHDAEPLDLDTIQESIWDSVEDVQIVAHDLIQKKPKKLWPWQKGPLSNRIEAAIGSSKERLKRIKHILRDTSISEWTMKHFAEIVRFVNNNFPDENMLEEICDIAKQNWNLVNAVGGREKIDQVLRFLWTKVGKYDEDTFLEYIESDFPDFHSRNTLGVILSVIQRKWKRRIELLGRLLWNHACTESIAWEDSHFALISDILTEDVETEFDPEDMNVIFRFSPFVSFFEKMHNEKIDALKAVLQSKGVLEEEAVA